MGSAILWILLIGGLMFLMHRGLGHGGGRFGHGGGGCGRMGQGADGGHSGHVGHAENADKTGPSVRETARDPVCGMMIDPGGAGAKSEYQGATYYFCSAACKRQFDANPTPFASAAATAGSGAPHGKTQQTHGHGGHSGHCC